MRKLHRFFFLVIAALLSTGALADQSNTVTVPNVPNNWRVIVIDNSGREKTFPSKNQREAMVVAQKSKVASNRTVKVADTLGPLYAWVRVGGSTRNRWAAHALSTKDSFD